MCWASTSAMPSHAGLHGRDDGRRDARAIRGRVYTATQCGAERFAKLKFQQAIKGKLGIYVSGSAITDHTQSLRDDIGRRRGAPEVPPHVVSGLIYDFTTVETREVIPHKP